MLFTIAIPAYNKEDTIERAILSCIKQDIDQEYEIIIVDNASTDKTLEIAQGYAKKNSNVRIFSNKVNVNMWSNHNICMLHASGDYVLFCHTDDVLLPNALQVIYEKLLERKLPKKYVVWGHSTFNDYKAVLDKYKWRIGDYIVGSEAFKLFANGGLVPSGTCYSRETFLQIGGFIEDIHMIFPNSDSSSMIRFAFDGFAFEMLDNIIFLRDQSSSSHLNTKPKKQEKEAYMYMKGLLMENFSECKIAQILGASSDYNASFCYAYYIAGIKKFKKTALKRCIRAFIKRPANVRNKFFRKTLYKSIFK